MKYRSIKDLVTTNDSLIPVRFIDKLEDVLHGVLGILLFVISVLAAASLSKDSSKPARSFLLE